MRITIAILTLFLAVTCPQTSYAETGHIPLSFDAISSEDKLNFIQSENKDNEIKISPHTTEISRIDLNSDGLDEVILRDKDCVSKNRSCQYLIYAEPSIGTKIRLGKINAKEIIISPKKTSGIRDILVYNRAKNDYAFDTYSWNSRQSQYTKKDTLRRE